MGKVRKVSVIPFEEEDLDAQSQQGECTQQTGHGSEVVIEKAKSKSIRERANLKILNLLRVMSKLASIQGYDDEGRIKTRDGLYMNNTDIAFLLQNAMTPGKLIVGQDEFIHLLINAKVDPSLILNENVRSKLLNANPRLQTDAVSKIEENVQARYVSTSKKDIESPESPINATVIENNQLINSKRGIEELIDSDENDDKKPEIRVKKRKNELPRNWIVPGEL